MKKNEIFDILSKKEKYRLNYHLMPAKGLLNDPNGLVEKNGKYYVFYQWNDKESAHGAKKWGLYTSKDFINWEICDSALNPTERYETHGCYSGSGILVNDKIHLIYTGNVKDENDNRESYQCMAIENEQGTFDKIGPVIDKIPVGYTEHFRDPKVWKENDNYYMVIGAQNIQLLGEVLLYKSLDLKKWDLIGSIYDKNDMGYMIECPDLFKLGDETVLSCSPQGLEAQGNLYNNIFQSGYMTGQINLENGNAQWSEFVELDRGFDFYAPQTFVDSKGRRIMYAWMGIEETGHPTIESESWVHAMTMPRELFMENKKIIQKPLEEMKTLRKNQKKYSEIKIDSSIKLEGLEGDSFELVVDFENINSSSFGLKLRKSQNEELIIKFENNRLILDRNNTPYIDGIRACKVEGNKHKLHIFMDKTSVEIFYNDGKEVFTSRIFSEADARGIEFFSENGSIIAKNIEFYELDSFNYFVK